MENSRFKFRAWDKINNKWFSQSGDFRFKEYPCLIAIGLHGLPIAMDADSFKNDEVIGWNRDHNIEIMQYTGLKDKNSVEVYQNDIGIDKFGRKVIVKWNEEECCFALLTIDDVVKDEWNFCLRDLVEVIGNIYENENLLKE